MKFSKITFLFCALLIIFAGSVFYPRWQKDHGEAQISWDASGYYWYLPSLFIYKDIKGQGFKDSIIQKYQPTTPGDPQQVFLDEASGNYVLKYSPGVAIMEAPFFFIAHFLAASLGYPADGFSPPYQVMIYLGGLLCTLIGLWYFRKLLSLFYNDYVTGIVLFLLVFGTNYLNYCGIDVGMSHTWLFTLYVFIVLNTHYYYQYRKRKYALRVGVLIGLITITRPPEFIAILIPLLWGLEGISVVALKSRLVFLSKQKLDVLFALLIGGSIISIQLIYWKYATGHWFVYTYGEQGFVWLSPLFKVYTFNYQCGWLTYTPLMMLPLIGFIPFIKWGNNKVAIIAMILLNYYVVCSWGAWDMGGRAMVQGYVLLAFPLSALIAYLLGTKVLKWIALPMILMLAYFNIWWTYQAHAGGLTGDAPSNRKYYLSTIFRYNLPKEIQKLRDNDDLYQAEIRNSHLLYENNFDEENDKGCLEINKEHPISKRFAFPKPDRKYDWIRGSADFKIDSKEWNVWQMTQFILSFKNKNEIVQSNLIRIQRFLKDGEQKNITIDALVPTLDYDVIEITFLNDNGGSKPCYIDNLRVIGFND